MCFWKENSFGADAVVSPSEWSNWEVFKLYLQNHVLKVCPRRKKAEVMLILYDGHRSRVSPDLVESANANNIVLFVLPPHTSYILKPLDIGCFGQNTYSQECTHYTASAQSYIW